MRRNPAGCVTACDAATCAQSRSKWRRRRWLRWRGRGDAFLLLPSKNDHTNFFLSIPLSSSWRASRNPSRSHTRSCLGARTLNRLCAVSFIMPATPGPGASGPRTSSGGLRAREVDRMVFHSLTAVAPPRSLVRITSIPKAGILLTV